MSTTAQIAANTINSQSSTGARTEAGHAASSKNATTHGLYASQDFIRPGEQPLYDQIEESLARELAPQGLLELNLVDEIHRAMWRLHRCGIVEASFNVPGEAGEAIPDPMQNEAQAKLQLSVDRARNQAHRLLHKCTAELRKLQTERQYRNESFPEGTDISNLGICDLATIHKDVGRQIMAEYRRKKFTRMAEINALPDIRVPKSGSFCKSDPAPASQAA